MQGRGGAGLGPETVLHGDGASRSRDPRGGAGKGLLDGGESQALARTAVRAQKRGLTL